MKIKIIAIGNKMLSWINEAFKNYILRITHEFSPLLIEIKPEKKFASIEQKKLNEAHKILGYLNKEYLIILDDKGTQFTSSEFSQKLKYWSENLKSIVFVIGGAEGIHEEILNKANLVWSLSKATFPHTFVRVMIAEQLFRAYSILENHPYHRE